jgi:hypothetical protein
VVAVSLIANEIFSELRDAFHKWRHRFCDEAMGRLPSEILDMIFGHAIEAEYIVHYDDKDRRFEVERGVTTSKRSKFRCHGFDAFPVLPAPGRTLLDSPHENHDKQVAPLFNTFFDVSQPFGESIAHFLLHNRASLEVKALARLDDVLNINAITLPRSMRLHYCQKDVGGAAEWKAILEPLEEILKRRIRPHTTIELALHLKPASCTSFVRVVARVLFELKDMGVNINVIHALDVRTPTNRRRKHAEIREHDLTWLFKNDLKTFQQDIMVNGKSRKTLVSALCNGIRWGCTDVLDRRRWASR